MSLTTPQKISLVVFVGLIVGPAIAIALYDLWAASTHQDATISWAIALWVAGHPFASAGIGFAAGVTVGALAVHFFAWRLQSPAEFAEMARLRAEVDRLEAENDRLRDRVVTLMVDADGGRPSSLS